MREGLFIKKNKDRWERIQHDTAPEPDEMAKDFTQLVDDLGYAKTFYPTSKVTQYLNALASKIYLGIYQNRKERSNRLKHFFVYDVPSTVAKHHRIILFSLSIFILFFSVGFFSSMQDETFVRQVLGDGYVDTTEKNIEEGNPFNVYADSNPVTILIPSFAPSFSESSLLCVPGNKKLIPIITPAPQVIMIAVSSSMPCNKTVTTASAPRPFAKNMCSKAPIRIDSLAREVMLGMPKRMPLKK